MSLKPVWIARNCTAESTWRVAAAGQHGFVRRDPNAHTLTIHRAIGAVIRDEMAPSLRVEWASRAASAVGRTFPDPTEVGHWSQCERLLARERLDWIERLGVVTLEAANLLNRLGYYLDERGQYEKVEPVYRRALDIRTALLGAEHPDVATSLNNLGWHFRARGRYELAGPLYERASKCVGNCWAINRLTPPAV